MKLKFKKTLVLTILCAGVSTCVNLYEIFISNFKVFAMNNDQNTNNLSQYINNKANEIKTTNSDINHLRKKRNRENRNDFSNNDDQTISQTNFQNSSNQVNFNFHLENLNNNGQANFQDSSNQMNLIIASKNPNNLLNNQSEILVFNNCNYETLTDFGYLSNVTNDSKFENILNIFSNFPENNSDF